MPARLKRWGFIGLLMVIVVAGTFIFLCHQRIEPAPLSIEYVGIGSFTNVAALRSGPTFAITNHTSQNMIVTWQVDMKIGTNWFWDSMSEFDTIKLSPKTGAYVTVVFKSKMRTSPWRLSAGTGEQLNWPTWAAGVLRGWWEGKFQKVPIRLLFSPRQPSYQNPHHYVSEEIDPKSPP